MLIDPNGGVGLPYSLGVVGHGPIIGTSQHFLIKHSLWWTTQWININPFVTWEN